MACEGVSGAGAFAYGWIPVDAVIRVWFNTSGYGGAMHVGQEMASERSESRTRGREVSGGNATRLDTIGAASWQAGEKWRPVC